MMKLHKPHQVNKFEGGTLTKERTAGHMPMSSVFQKKGNKLSVFQETLTKNQTVNYKKSQKATFHKEKMPTWYHRRDRFDRTW